MCTAYAVLNEDWLLAHYSMISCDPKVSYGLLSSALSRWVHWYSVVRPFGRDFIHYCLWYAAAWCEKICRQLIWTRVLWLHCPPFYHLYAISSHETTGPWCPLTNNNVLPGRVTPSLIVSLKWQLKDSKPLYTNSLNGTIIIFRLCLLELVTPLILFAKH